MTTALVPNVSADDLAAVVGRENDTGFVSTLGQICVDLARDAASSYCRGVGFDDPDSIPASLRHVVLLRAVRICANYEQLARQQGDGTLIDYGPGANGFTVQELLSLDQYRKTAA